jgi:hypothetical protein
MESFMEVGQGQNWGCSAKEERKIMVLTQSPIQRVRGAIYAATPAKLTSPHDHVPRLSTGTILPLHYMLLKQCNECIMFCYLPLLLRIMITSGFISVQSSWRHVARIRFCAACEGILTFPDMLTLSSSVNMTANFAEKYAEKCLLNIPCHFSFHFHMTILNN